ncbi:vacuolar protein sorting 28 [Anaeramoeba flamelloides]|uniref:Vacuolar protein sorting 28 n=1 Tax=Anaeramoeba flamelloides TaxID=1746091 RepID=A0ABQ8X459_9EUKA|nr:vacuolar protein sorting 28 [Anaeramoeba flamelloides]
MTNNNPYTFNTRSKENNKQNSYYTNNQNYRHYQPNNQPNNNLNMNKKQNNFSRTNHNQKNQNNYLNNQRNQNFNYNNNNNNNNSNVNMNNFNYYNQNMNFKNNFNRNFNLNDQFSNQQKQKFQRNGMEIENLEQKGKQTQNQNRFEGIQIENINENEPKKQKRSVPQTNTFGPKTKCDVNVIKHATQSIKKPLKLFTNTKEREKVDNYANLYSIIKTVDLLERAYVRDAISSETYTKECGKLISQFKVALDSVGMEIENVSKWMEGYGMNCKAAEKTLIEQGVPSTVMYGNSYEKQEGESGVFIFQTASFFITAMDSVKLNMIAVDQLQPVLSDLLNSLNKIDKLKPDFDGKVRITKWLKTFNLMRASDELSNEQSRQLLFDLETSYNLLNSILKNN